MARRNAVSDFFSGFNQGYNTVGKVLTDKEMRDISNAPIEEIQGDVKEKAAPAGYAYDEESGQYWPTDANVKQEPLTPAFETTPTKYKLLGDVFDKAPTETQQDRTRALAMSRVFSKFGDPIVGQRLRRDVASGDLADLQIADAKRNEERQQNITAADKMIAESMKKRIKIGDDGQPVPLTDDDMIMADKLRTMTYAGHGLFEEANKAATSGMDRVSKRLNLETAERTKAAGEAKSRVMMGDYGGAVDFYNKFIPDGSTATGAVKNKDGSVSIQRISAIDGKPLSDMKVKDEAGVVAALDTLTDPQAAGRYIQNTFQNDIERRRLHLASASEGRQAERWRIEKPILEGQAADAKETRETRKEYKDAVESGDPELVKKARLKAMSSGIKLPGDDDKYTVDMNEITTAFGTPATNEDGSIVADPMTGKQTIVRNIEEEQKFFQWMREHGIKDSNKGLAIYKAQMQAPTGKGAPGGQKPWERHGGAPTAAPAAAPAAAAAPVAPAAAAPTEPPSPYIQSAMERRGNAAAMAQGEAEAARIREEEDRAREEAATAELVAAFKKRNG